MFEWHKTIQAMVDIIEKQLYNNFDEEITLTSLAKELGYSKFHITKRFKSLTGMTFRDYLRLRRLAYSVIELRDTNNRIIDVAVKYGFCSQEAYTRAFKNSYGTTPYEYRNKKMPLVLKNKYNTFDPYYLLNLVLRYLLKSSRRSRWRKSIWKLNIIRFVKCMKSKRSPLKS